ncbi:uncharacterized protein LOC105700400 [Orussus abietinus]|uniref:uncharacterized protein LOC105700400 n=1 Tax=Orussus abietinus TaxID=222816 RepID=UPI0006259E7F|nr:uncharacterized protein LOC105700400 [Orussus abietinus]
MYGNYRSKNSRIEELAMPRIRKDNTSNVNAFKVKRRALSYQITDSLNKLAQPKHQRHNNNEICASRSTKESSNGAGQSDERSTVKKKRNTKSNRFERRIFLDNYTKMAAASHNRKMLRDVPKPKRTFTDGECSNIDEYYHSDNRVASEMKTNQPSERNMKQRANYSSILKPRCTFE